MPSFFNQILKGIYESSAGRIRWFSHMWAIIGSPWDKKRVVNQNLKGTSRVNDRGEWEQNGTTLVHRLSTGSCPKPPGDNFHQDPKSGRFWVPATECRKCPHHIKAGRPFNFPRCTFERSKEGKDIAAQTVQKVNEITEQALKKANEIMGESNQ